MLLKQYIFAAYIMKKTIFYISVAAIAMAMASCGSKATEATDADSVAQAGKGAVTYKVETSKSTVKWHGSKAVGMGEHNGTINISSGTLHSESGVLTSGSFELDMKSIAVTDELDEKSKGMLIGHLQSDEFFNVEKFATAKFEISKVEAKADGENTHVITGNLTIRDSVKSISFPANVSINDLGIVAKAKVTINRLDWGINYDKEKMSLSEAAQQTAKNGIVSNEIGFELNIQAIQ